MKWVNKCLKLLLASELKLLKMDKPVRKGVLKPVIAVMQSSLAIIVWVWSVVLDLTLLLG